VKHTTWKQVKTLIDMHFSFPFGHSWLLRLWSGRRGREATRSGLPSPRVADQTVERDWRQAMPHAEPALSLAPLHLSAVVGAAIRTGITTPVKGVLGTTTLRLTAEFTRPRRVCTAYLTPTPPPNAEAADKERRRRGSGAVTGWAAACLSTPNHLKITSGLRGHRATAG
jgi:hypothetical protein